MSIAPTKLVAIIGCAKSGTTALAKHLDTRPDMVLGTIKEPSYFSDFAHRSWSGPATQGLAEMVIGSEPAYFENFVGLEPAQWAIDASTDYIWSERATERLLAFSKACEVKVICVIRDPLERAISEYNHTLRHKWETERFGTSLDLEAERMAAGWHPLFYHQRRSTIHADVHRYKAAFGDNFLLVDYQELKTPDALLARIATFLGLDHIPVERIANANQSSLPRNRVIAKLLNAPALRSLGRTVLPQTARDTLRAALHTNSRNVTTASAKEHQKYCDLMGDEIRRCMDDPVIPTQSWRKTAALL